MMATKKETGKVSIRLGSRYKDRLHGIEGIATARTKYLEGCDRICLENIDKDETIREYWFDITRLLPVKSRKDPENGGPNKIPPKYSIERKDK